MRVLAVDDKAMPRRVLVRAIAEAAPDADVVACRNASEALALPDLASFEVAFIDIDLPGMNGIELARTLKRLNPVVNVIFATGYDEYMADAFDMHSSGYLLKPVTPDDVADELANLRFPTIVVDKPLGLFMQCFGDFEVFADGHALAFERAKSKELLAYLVDRRGAVVSLREAEAVLWETPMSGDRVSSSYLRTLVADLRRSLELCGHPDVLVKRRGAIGVDVARFHCDYYDYLSGKPLAINRWRGEYMSQYSWAEATRAELIA